MRVVLNKGGRSQCTCATQSCPSTTPILAKGRASKQSLESRQFLRINHADGKKSSACAPQPAQRSPRGVSKNSQSPQRLKGSKSCAFAPPTHHADKVSKAFGFKVGPATIPPKCFTSFLVPDCSRATCCTWSLVQFAGHVLSCKLLCAFSLDTCSACAPAQIALIVLSRYLHFSCCLHCSSYLLCMCLHVLSCSCSACPLVHLALHGLVRAALFGCATRLAIKPDQPFTMLWVKA